MGSRVRLRQLIDALEARYSSLPDDATHESFDGDINSVVSRSPPSAWTTAANDRMNIARTLEDVLSAVRREITHLHAASLRLKNSRNHAVALPAEVLQHIFAFVCVGPSQAWHDKDNHMREHRAAIIGTCWHWRDVALHDTSLWSTIVIRRIDDIEDPDFSKSTPLDIVQLELARSADRPLSLYVAIDDDNWDDNTALLVKSLARRCEKLCLSCEGDHTDFFGSVIGTTPLPRLRSLSLQIDYNSLQSHSIDLSGYKLLNTLDVNVSAELPLKYSSQCNIKKLSLMGKTEPLSAVGLINACRQLERLVWLNRVDHAQVPHPNILAALSHLHLMESDVGCPITHLTAPNLTHLKLSIRRESESDCKLLTSGTSQFPKLRYLVVSRIIDSDVFTRFLRAHPALETIGFTIMKLSICAAQCLITTTSSGTFVLPNLARVHARTTSMLEAEERTAIQTLLDARLSRQPDNPERFVLYLRGSSEMRANKAKVDPTLTQQYPGHVLYDNEGESTIDEPWR